MKAAYLAGIRRIALREVEIPRPGPREVLVRIEFGATCGTDLKAWRRGHSLFPPPSPFGHEWIGTVSEAGPDARIREGTRVVGLPSAPCGGCARCSGGHANLCAIERGLLAGAFADTILVPPRIASQHLFETDLPAARAILLEPLSCVVHALSNLSPRRAMVLGGGPTGLLFVAYLAHQGTHVSFWGRHEARRILATRFGAQAVAGPTTTDFHTWGRSHGPFDLLAETTGDLELLSHAESLVVPTGMILPFAGPPVSTHVRLDLHRLHYHGITLRVPFHYDTAAARRAFAFLQESPAPLEDLITEILPLDRLPEAFDRLDAGQGIKYLIRP